MSLYVEVLSGFRGENRGHGAEVVAGVSPRSWTATKVVLLAELSLVRILRLERVLAGLGWRLSRRSAVAVQIGARLERVLLLPHRANIDVPHRRLLTELPVAVGAFHIGVSFDSLSEGGVALGCVG